MNILSLLTPTNDNIYYNIDFRIMLRSHYNYFLSRPDTVKIALNSFDTYKYENDLIGLLDNLNIPKHLHWLVMILNDFTSPEELTAGTTSLIIPAASDVNMLKNVFMQRTNIL